MRHTFCSARGRFAALIGGAECYLRVPREPVKIDAMSVVPPPIPPELPAPVDASASPLADTTAPRAGRPEPRLIRIAPRLTHPRDILAMSVLPGFAMILMAVALVVLDQPHAGNNKPSKIETAAWWLGGIGAFLALLIGGLAWSLNRVRQRFLERCRREQESSETGAEVFTRKWSGQGRHTPEALLRDVVVEYVTGRHPRSWIVCIGMVDVPAPDPMPFEPEIIFPGRLIWTYASIGVLAIAGFLLLFWLLPLFYATPTISSEHALLIVFVFLIAGPVLCRWLWITAIRPTYIRIAPGMIQVIEYRWRKERPTIRSYPIDGGTLVVVTNQLWSDLSLALMRDGNTESFALSGIRNARAVQALVWRALLSRAATPPLSNEALVG